MQHENYEVGKARLDAQLSCDIAKEAPNIQASKSWDMDAHKHNVHDIVEFTHLTLLPSWYLPSLL